MVGVLRHDRAAVAGHAGGEAPGEVVRLAAGVHEQHGVQARVGRERRQQPFGELDERRCEVPRVRCAEPCLADDRLRHARVAVAHDGHVVVGVEEPATVRLVNPDALCANRVDGAAVRERGQETAERLIATPGQLAARGRRSRAAELTRDVLRREAVEQLEQSPRVVVPGFDVLGILGEAAGTPGADRDDRGEPGDDQVAEQLELERLEGEVRAEAVERDTRDPKDVSGRPPPQIGRERNRDVGRERGVAAVAEIEDAGEPALLVQQQVVEVEVAVDDLGTQPGPFG